MGLIGRIRQRENNSLISERLFREQCVTNSLVNSMAHTYTLHGHSGCVNSINWNMPGTLLASGSDDQHISVWRDDGRMVRQLNTAHTNNIFSVIFIPYMRDRLVVSASGDAQVLLHDLEQQPVATSAAVWGQDSEHRHIQRWKCGDRVKQLATCAAEPRLFWSTSEDGVLRQYDLRDNRTVDLLNMVDQYQLKSLAINEVRPEMFAVGLSDAFVPIYDRRCMKEPMFRLLPANLHIPSEGGRFLATHLAFNKRGDELLVNISSDNIYIFDVRDPNRHDSPDVLSTLKNFISDAAASKTVAHVSSSSSHGRNGTIPSPASSTIQKDDDDEKLLLEQLSHIMKSNQELTEKIDNCSQFLSQHWGSFIRKLKIFSVDNNNSQQFAQPPCRNAFIQCLCTRAYCLKDRCWDGDQWDSVRDCLTVLRFSPLHEFAHFLLIKCLAALKQFQLAAECFKCFCSLHPSDAEKTTELEQLLSEKKSADEGQKLWTSDYTARHRDYVHRYTGHLNINTDIKESNWFGPDDQYIVAGSDCGSMFIWERNSQRIVKAFKGDRYTVNCCQPHPCRCLIASSGIDDVIRFWEPASTDLKKATEEGFPDEAEDKNITELYELMKRNRRVRTPELLWEQLLNSVELGLFQVDSTRGGGEDDDQVDRAADNDDDGEEDATEGTHVVQCRQM